MDNALVKNAQALRSRPQDCQDTTNGLLHMKSCFSHTALDYVYSVSIFRLNFETILYFYSGL